MGLETWVTQFALFELCNSLSALSLNQLIQLGKRCICHHKHPEIVGKWKIRQHKWLHYCLFSNSSFSNTIWLFRHHIKTPWDQSDISFFHHREDLWNKIYALVKTNKIKSLGQEMGEEGVKKRGWHLVQGGKELALGGGGCQGLALLSHHSADSFPQCGQMWNLALWPCSPGTP